MKIQVNSKRGDKQYRKNSIKNRLRKVYENNENYETVNTTKEAISNSKAVMKDKNKKYNKTNRMTMVGTGDDELTFAQTKSTNQKNKKTIKSQKITKDERILNKERKDVLR